MRRDVRQVVQACRALFEAVQKGKTLREGEAQVLMTELATLEAAILKDQTEELEGSAIF